MHQGHKNVDVHARVNVYAHVCIYLGRGWALYIVFMELRPNNIQDETAKQTTGVSIKFEVGSSSE